MHLLRRRPFVCSAAWLASTVLAQAHPGHEGHELTWDLGHLAGHPLATLGCAAVLVVAAWAAFRIARQNPAGRPQSLRGSQARPGN